MEKGGVLGAYRIQSELGSGGMGRVYAATVEGRVAGLEVGDCVALKVVHPHLLETPGFFKRFMREAEIGQNVRHENVVRTYDCDQLSVDGVIRNFLAMEYVEGQTLRELLHELERVPEELCRHIGSEVCKGLAAIHEAGVVHRDIKPDNVLITPDYVVKIMDLGVARLTDEALRLSQSGAFVGSIHYASPEQFQDGGTDLDGRADLHALGLVLYELASGINPYYADDVPQILRRILHEEPRRLGDVNPQLSPFFEEIVHCLLQKRRDARFGSATEAALALGSGEESTWWGAQARAIRAETARPLRRIRIPRETAVYGREPELSALRALYDEVRAGDGRVVLIEGEAGIGKSRLVDELVGRLQREGEDINFVFGSYPPNGAATASGAFSAAYRAHFGDDGSAAYLRQTPVLVPAFDALLGGVSAPPGVEPLTKDSLQTCFVHATRALAAERVTVVLIDDLHFAPEEGRALFVALAMAIPEHRVLLIGTTRPGISADWRAGLERFDHASTLTPPRLGAKDLVHLLSDALKSDVLATSLVGQIALKSDGNPFFVFEIVRGLRDGQFITQQDDGTWVSTRMIEQMQIPSSVLDLVNARVADLDDDERNLLDVAACWGYEFDPTLVGAVFGMKRIPTLQAFGKIEKRHRLVRSVGRTYVFDHHQVQETLYGTLNEQLREEYHGALADALETRERAADREPTELDGTVLIALCEHFLCGAEPHRGERYLKAAVEHHIGGHVNDSAALLLERALALPAMLTGVQRIEALLRFSWVNFRLARIEQSMGALDEAAACLSEAADDTLEAKVWRARASLLTETTQLAAAIEAHARAAECCRRAGDEKGEVSARLGGVWLRGLGGGDPDVAADAQRLVAEAQRIGDPDLLLTARGHAASFSEDEASGDTIIEIHQEQLARARESGKLAGLDIVLGNLGSMLMSRGRLAEADAALAEAVDVSRRCGFRAGVGWLTTQSKVRLLLGDLDAAQRMAREGHAASVEGGDRRWAVLGRGRLALVAYERGDLETLESLAAEVIQANERLGLHGSSREVQMSRALLRRDQGRYDDARADLKALRDEAVEGGYPLGAVIPRACIALLPGGGGAMELAALANDAARLGLYSRMVFAFLRWTASQDRAFLTAAAEMLDALVASAPPEFHETMLTNVRLHREITAARQHG